MGFFYGDIVMEFEDGNVIKGSIPNGYITGMMFGETKFLPQGAAYSYDPNNKLVCSYYVK